MKKKSGIIFFIIFLVIIVSLVVISKNIGKNGIKKETVQCIASKSELYTQLGCHACENQKEIFGENYQYLNVIDCFYEQDKCKNITATPTWIISGEKYLGLQTIERLKELTGCK